MNNWTWFQLNCSHTIRTARINSSYCIYNELNCSHSIRTARINFSYATHKFHYQLVAGFFYICYTKLPHVLTIYLAMFRELPVWSTYSTYMVLPKISKNLLIITWILTLNPNYHHHLRSSHLGLIYNDPSDFATFGSTHWSLPALASLVSVAILLGHLQWRRNIALSTRVLF